MYHRNKTCTSETLKSANWPKSQKDEENPRLIFNWIHVTEILNSHNCTSLDVCTIVKKPRSSIAERGNDHAKQNLSWGLFFPQHFPSCFFAVIDESGHSPLMSVRRGLIPSNVFKHSLAHHVSVETNRHL